MAHANANSATGQRRLGGSIAWRLILPVPLMLIVATVAIWIGVPRIIAGKATGDAVLASQQIAAQFKTIRACYTESLVNEV